MFGGAKSRAAKPLDPLRARFGLRRKALKPAVRAAFDALLEENARLAARLAEAEALADRDPLTQAGNRRAFMRALHQAMSYAERYGTPAAVLFIDLDGFKAVNDGFGHAAGDAVLIHVARLLHAQVRESDVVGRIGGDEFGVILQHASLEDAHRKAEALMRAFEAQPATHAGVTHRVTASIGVHGFAGLEDPEIALARADEAMYAAKHLRKRDAARGAA
ncbi:MAG: GGDEF domain-containing protein [Hydrogenophilaceae bacterium]|jgi:diguanylate cyclase (GGDEF)-like protein|nr:GGDEF domain-containing protein [Hydrogenophilaceae bacterium]